MPTKPTSNGATLEVPTAVEIPSEVEISPVVETPEIPMTREERNARYHLIAPPEVLAHGTDRQKQRAITRQVKSYVLSRGVSEADYPKIILALAGERAACELRFAEMWICDIDEVRQTTPGMLMLLPPLSGYIEIPEVTTRERYRITLRPEPLDGPQVQHRFMIAVERSGGTDANGNPERFYSYSLVIPEADSSHPEMDYPLVLACNLDVDPDTGGRRLRFANGLYRTETFRRRSNRGNTNNRNEEPQPEREDRLANLGGRQNLANLLLEIMTEAGFPMNRARNQPNRLTTAYANQGKALVPSSRETASARQLREMGADDWREEE